ncbi:MAG: hypothetical protein LOD88_08030 [Novibacillus thermophilus]
MGEGVEEMVEQSEAELLQEYSDYLIDEKITLRKVSYSDGVRYQVKWTRKVDQDYQVDFTEFQTVDDARKTFLDYIRTYVLKDNRLET